MDDLRQVETSADVMLHGYTVHSHLPLIGPLIAWIRRNMTSHLREPYLDKMLDNQERFNWHVVMMLRGLAGRLIEARQAGADLPDLSKQMADLLTRQKELEREIESLNARLAQSRGGDSGQDEPTDG